MRTTLEQLIPGMKLASDLVETGGRLLLPSGTALTERHLRYFQMWGITDVDTWVGEGTPAESFPPVDPVQVAAAESRLAGLFRHTDLSHPVVAFVHAHCVSREIRRATAGGSHHVG